MCLRRLSRREFPGVDFPALCATSSRHISYRFASATSSLKHQGRPPNLLTPRWPFCRYCSAANNRLPTAWFRARGLSLACCVLRQKSIVTRAGQQPVSGLSVDSSLLCPRRPATRPRLRQIAWVASCRSVVFCVAPDLPVWTRIWANPQSPWASVFPPNCCATGTPTAALPSNHPLHVRYEGPRSQCRFTVTQGQHISRPSTHPYPTGPRCFGM